MGAAWQAAQPRLLVVVGPQPFRLVHIHTPQCKVAMGVRELVRDRIVFVAAVEAADQPVTDQREAQAAQASLTGAAVAAVAAHQPVSLPEQQAEPDQRVQALLTVPMDQLPVAVGAGGWLIT